jgi:hypothetical protein
MVADLLQGQNHLQHQPLAPEGVRLAGDDAQAFLHHRFVERGLRRREGAVLVLLDLVRQVVDDRPVGLQPAQQEGGGDPPEALDHLLVAMRLDRNGVLLDELRQLAEIAAVGEVHDAPVLREPVLDRRAAHGDEAASPGWPSPPGSGRSPGS